MTPSSESHRVTLKDIARLCGVTRMTVSKALRAHPEVSERTRARILEAAAQLGYDPSLAATAKRLAQRRVRGARFLNRVIGVNIGSARPLAVAYFRRQCEGILATLEDHGYAALMLAAGLQTAEKARTVLAPLIRGEIDALLALSSPTAIPLIETLRRHAGLRECPAVVLMHQTQGWGSVVTDDAAGVREMARRLFALGHRHFLRVSYGYDPQSGGEPADGESRRAALCRTLAECGLANPEAHVLRHPCPAIWMSPLAARARLQATESDADDRALLATLAAHPQVTAILADNDAIAMHVYGALQRAGMAVPGRYSLAGFDDTDPIPGLHGENVLSSVALPLEEVGRQAAEMALAAVEQGKPVGHLVLPTRFVPRASIGPAPGVANLG